jgi:hypothetical protein
MTMNKLKIVILFFVILIGCTKNKNYPIIKGHAHNDYEHVKPLLDALKNGFISVEADVHLMNDELYVSHNTPIQLDSLKTLEFLYLKPLKERIKQNKGNVYAGYDGFFYLMIDIKTAAAPSYKKLKLILKDYETIISKVVNGKEEKKKPIKIVITGHHGRPYDQILADEPRLVAIDGRFKELGKGISAELMPYISENYKHHLSYSGIGEPSKEDTETLINLVKTAHKERKKLRFWASPDNEAVWSFLLNHNVDFVNTDSLVKFNKYILFNKN